VALARNARRPVRFQRPTTMVQTLTTALA
jgi:hypothetical protein